MDRPRLTAKELYKRYRQGERNFVGVNLSGESLCGINLRGINLREADLSHADLRGTNLTDAILAGAKLCGVKTGTQQRWVVPKLLIAWTLTAVSSVLSTTFWSYFATILFNPIGSHPTTDTVYGDIICAMVGIAILFSFFLSSYFRGILATLGVGIAIVAGIVAFVVAVTFAVAGADTAASAGFVAVFVAFAATTAVAFAGAIATSGAIAGFAAIAIAVAIAVAIAIPVAIFLPVVSNATSAVALAGTTATLAWAYFINYRAMQGDRRDHLIRIVAVWFAGWGGTQFKGADLTDADCSKSIFKCAHIYGATLIRTRFHLAQQMNLARLGKTILSDFAVQDLLITLRGRGKAYWGKNLKGANLVGADLVGADFTEADLSQATLEGAELQQANLTKTQVLGTGFRQANLTGACLEAWNIDSTTQLDGTLCDYIYLLKPPQERRPSSGIFQPGEFTKLFEEVLDTIDLIFQNGIDWKAFAKAFDKVRVDNDGTELTIQSIENKGDGVIVVRVDAPPDSNKEKIHSEFKQTYEEIRQQLEVQYKQQLNAKDREIGIYEQQSVQMWSVINRLAERPPVSTIENILGNKFVNDQSQTFQGNVNINAQNSVVNLRDISGQVSNQINQLPTELAFDQPNLKDLLAQLQSAVEADSELGENEKVEALVEVGELAKAAQSPKEGVMQKAAKGAMNALKGITAGLSDASKLASACKELIPLITSMFGLP